MGNNVTVGFGSKGIAKLSSDIDNLKDRFAKLKSEGAKGFAIGAAAGATTFALNELSQAGGEVVSFIQTSIAAASDLNETLQKSSVVFGSAEGDIEAFGKTAAKSMGLSENAAIGAAASIGNLLLSTGTAPAKIAPMSESIVKLASDLASFNNISVEDALAKLQSGLVGQERPLRELGVAISAAAVDTEAANLGFKKINGTFTEGEKVQARYSLIFKQTTTAQGDFARTADQMANQQRILQAELEDTSAKFGTALIPVVIEAQKEFIKLFDVLGGFPSETASIGSSIHDLIQNGDIAGLQKAQAALQDATDKFKHPDLIFNPGAFNSLMDDLSAVDDALEHTHATTSNTTGKMQDDFDAVSLATGGMERKVRDDFVGVTKASKDWRDAFHKDTGKIIRDADKVRDQLASDAQDEIDSYFDPLEKRAELHDTREQLLADQETKRKAKTKEDSRQASAAIVQDLDDEATSLVDLAKQHQLTQTDVDRFTKDAKANYASLGKDGKKHIDDILTKLRSLQKFPDITTTWTLEQKGNYNPAALTVLAKSLGYTGNQDLYKKSTFTSTVTKRASGGPSAGLTLVGEQGPELLDLPSGSYVHNAQDTKAMGGGSWTGAPTVVNFPVTVYASPGMSAGDARQLAAAIGPALYADMQRRGMLPRTATGLRG